MNQSAFQKMKKTAYILNLSRGPVINERDLAMSLKKGEIAGLATDVLSVEPPPPNHLCYPKD